MLLTYVYFRFHRDHFWPVNAIDNANTYRVFKYQKPKKFLTINVSTCCLYQNFSILYTYIYIYIYI